MDHRLGRRDLGGGGGGGLNGKAARAVIESAPDPIVVLNAAGGVVDLNPAAEAAFRRTRDEVVGANATVMLAPKHVDAFHRWNWAADEANSHEYAGRRFEATGRRGDGTDFPMEIFITDLPEEPRLVAAFVRDLTLRDRLKESRERLASVVSSAPVMLLACDAQGTITLAEGSALSSLCLTPAEAVGRNLRELAGWDAQGANLIDRVLCGESVDGRLHVAGLDVHLNLASRLVRDDDGEVRGISVVLTDVTARVRAGEAERASTEKSRLMAMMNHEVRTPLNSILGFTRLLRNPQLGALSAQQHHYVANIESAGNHLSELVDEALDMARLDMGRFEINLTDVAASGAIQQAVDQLRPLAEARGLALTLTVGPDVVMRADRRQLARVLLNLLSNAIRHTPPAGHVSVDATQGDADVLIAVADTGEGIGPEDQARLFEEFFQAANHAPGGIGLGLAISRRLVHAMGGTIAVASRLGEGSTFTVRLRRATRATA